MTIRPLPRPRAVLAALSLGIALAACDDPFAAFLLDVPETPSEVTLFDFATGRLQDPPAFDVISEQAIRVDQTNQWDFLFRVTEGTPALVPFGAVADTSSSQAGLLVSEQSFEGVEEAPTEGYETSEPVSIAEGDVLVARSRRDLSQILICNRFMKLEILDIDAAAATLTFRFLVNPNCGDRVLIPGEHGDP